MAAENDFTGKRVMFVGSYHQDHHWSEGLERGIREGLVETGVTFATHHMDTRRNRSIEFIREAAKQARNEIEAFAPDVVIICDDNAVKHVLQSYYKDAALPFVYCGVNWDDSVYGLPYRNTTGITEADLIQPLIQQLRPHAGGSRIGFLALDSVSSRKTIEWHQRREGIHYDNVYLVDSFDAWQEKFLALQNEVDILILGNQEGMKAWDRNEALDFGRKHSRIPCGALTPGEMEFALLGYLRPPEEQGRWAGRAATKILAGASPSSIPVAHNKEAHVCINLAYSQMLGITFPPYLFKRADILLPYLGRKVLYISSYITQVAWSRQVLTSMTRILERNGVELHTFFMGAKENPSDKHLRKKAREARQLIADFNPEVVITSDDAAAKYILAEYDKDDKQPFVFVGINGDAAGYDLPTENVTGMVKVEMIQTLYSQLKRYARGPKLGWLSERLPTMEKNLSDHGKLFGIKYDKVYMVETFSEWKKAFLSLQDEVDMLVLQAHHGIRGWDDEEAEDFVRQHTSILTGSLTLNMMDHAIIGYVHLPEEQGEWAAHTALRILDGTPPGNIPLTKNKHVRLMLNRKLLEQSGVIVDHAIYSRAESVE